MSLNTAVCISKQEQLNICFWAKGDFTASPKKMGRYLSSVYSFVTNGPSYNFAQGKQYLLMGIMNIFGTLNNNAFFVHPYPAFLLSLIKVSGTSGSSLSQGTLLNTFEVKSNQAELMMFLKRWRLLAPTLTC